MKKLLELSDQPLPFLAVCDLGLAFTVSNMPINV